jgi:hypothetical protein
MRKGDAVNHWRQTAVFCVLSQRLLAGAIDGVVIDGTTGQPKPAVTVHLVQPGSGGMQTLSSVESDRDGKFKIDHDAPRGAVALLQALHQGATYNLVLQPGAPASGLRLTIYDSTAKLGTAKVAQHVVMVQPTADRIRIGETLLLENSTRLTFLDAVKGSIQFYVPSSLIGELDCTVKAPDGVPITRAVEKTARADIYKVNYPLKPGETQFDLTYTVPVAATFAGKNLYADSSTRLVTPPSVTLSGTGVESLGQEPSTQAHIYGVRGSSYEVKIFNTGPLDGSEGSTTLGDADQPSVEEASARLYMRLPWILGLTFGILMLGGCLLYRRGLECA